MSDETTPETPARATTDQKQPGLIQRLQFRVTIQGTGGDYEAPASHATDREPRAVVALVDMRFGPRLSITLAGDGRRICGEWPATVDWLDVALGYCDAINGLGLDWSAPDMDLLRPVLRDANNCCGYVLGSP